MQAIADWLIRHFEAKPPSIVIGGEAAPYLRRWYVIPRNRWFNVYLHQFMRSDDDQALHDHPWINCSILLSGSYIEMTGRGVFLRRAGDVVFRLPATAHRVELDTDFLTKRPRPVWTLFLTGPRVREWGFLCPQGWRHWRDFTAGKRGETVGKGCDD